MKPEWAVTSPPKHSAVQHAWSRSLAVKEAYILNPSPKENATRIRYLQSTQYVIYSEITL